MVNGCFVSVCVMKFDMMCLLVGCMCGLYVLKICVICMLILYWW